MKFRLHNVPYCVKCKHSFDFFYEDVESVYFIYLYVWLNGAFQYLVNWKTTKYHTVGTVSKSNGEIIERGKLDTPNTQIHELWPIWFGTGTSVKGMNPMLSFIFIL